jgi:hypothetical protein
MEISFSLYTFSKLFGFGSLCMFTKCMQKIPAYVVTVGIQQENGSQWAWEWKHQANTMCNFFLCRGGGGGRYLIITLMLSLESEF